MADISTSSGRSTNQEHQQHHQIKGYQSRASAAPESAYNENLPVSSSRLPSKLPLQRPFLAREKATTKAPI
eukprot:scaffold69091_cov53-Cyclotella_meneghiniana.AAC.1